MDNCFTGRRDRSRQTPEKDVLYIIPAGPVSSVHSLGGASYLLPVRVTSVHLFRLARVVCTRVLKLPPSLKKTRFILRIESLFSSENIYFVLHTSQGLSRT